MLVISPHADDESIGCGGLLALYGKQCDLVLLTDGRKGHTTKEYGNEEKLVKVRKEEFLNAAQIAGVNKVVFLDIEDGTVFKNKKKITDNLDVKNYNYIFVPNRFESHLDHRVVYPIIKELKKKQKSDAIIYEYEVWTPLQHPTWFLDITSVSEKKRNMISQHISQLADVDYVTKGLALSCYRGMFNNSLYAEAYAHSAYSGIKKYIYEKLPQNMKLKIKSWIRR